MIPRTVFRDWLEVICFLLCCVGAAVAVADFFN